MFMLCECQDNSLESVLFHSVVPGWNSGVRLSDKCLHLLSPSHCPSVCISMTLAHCFTAHWYHTGLVLYFLNLIFSKLPHSGN